VLEPDAGEHLHARGDHAGGVVAAAEPGLDHRDLDLAARQLVVGRRGERLELGHAVVGLGGAVHERRRVRRALDRGREVLLRDGLLPHLDPLAERAQVRRGVAAGAQAVAGEDRGGEAGGRRLAVRADHVDRLELALREPQDRHQPAHPVEPEAHPEELEPEQVLLGLAEGHAPRRRSASR
jgi:hypothetical protein